MFVIILNIPMLHKKNQNQRVTSKRRHQRRKVEERRKKENINMRLTTEILFSCYRSLGWLREHPCEARTSITEKFRQPLIEALGKFVFNCKHDNVQVDIEDISIFCLEAFSKQSPIGKPNSLIITIESIVEHLNNSYDFTYKERRIEHDRRNLISN